MHRSQCINRSSAVATSSQALQLAHHKAIIKTHGRLLCRMPMIKISKNKTNNDNLPARAVVVLQMENVATLLVLLA
jgi:hypothetical protein